ncbi:unnamed protein product [Mytilus coruscus]|uniref:Uncharacterized protein n=1 Tax=Mytilus coruscus TaxID=42192 RepID=A0A6J8CDF8_MYTCO|nr:unnamed protein product [Mytilus coruscus]
MPPTHGEITYCNYIQHEHYVRQGDFCKTCDQCFPGLGLAPFTERQFEIDLIHGALGCLHCIQCPPGFYSNDLSFEECLRCTDCRMKGVYETQNCTSKQDTVCGKIKLKSTIHDGIHGNNSRQQIHLTPIICISVVCGVLAVLLAIVVYRHLRALVNLINWDPKAVKRNLDIHDHEVRRPTAHLHNWNWRKRRNARNQNEETKSAISKGLLAAESSGNSSLSSSKTTDSTFLSSSQETVETDGDENIFNSKSIVDSFIESHDCTIEVSEAHARIISKHIAVNSIFYDIGINLGIPDNDIKIIIENNKSDVKSQAYETLLKWKHLKASDATMLRFIDTVQRLKLQKVAKQFCNTYDEMIRPFR